MSTAALAAYALALLIATATPGPAMLAVLSTGVGRGPRRALAVVAGVTLGDALLLLLVLAGLAALAAAFGWLFAVIKYGGAAYLVWLGIRMWRAAPEEGLAPAAAGGGLGRDALLGVAVSVGNPKGILFHLSLMPLILDLSQLTPARAAVLVGIVLAVNVAVMGGCALLAGEASRWFRTPKRMRLLNRVAGGTMVGTGALVAAR